MSYSDSLKSAQRRLLELGNLFKIRPVLIVPTGIVILLLAWITLPNPAQLLTSERIILPVSVVEIYQKSSFELVNSYTGEIVPRRTSELGFQMAGQIEKVWVREGDQVTEGATLATLDSRRIEQQLREIIGAETEAKAILSELLAGPRSQELLRAVEGINDLDSQLIYAEASLRRQNDLLERSLGTQDAFDQASATVSSLKAAVASAKLTLDELNEGSRKEQIEAQAARVERLSANRALMEIEFDDIELQAPFTGSIAARYLDEGSVVNRGQAILRLIEDSAPTAWVGVPFDVSRSIQAGDKAQIVLTSGKYIEGQVSALLPQLNATTRTNTVVIDFDPELAEALPPSQVVNFEIKQQQPEAGFWLPADSLVRGTRGLWACLVVTPLELSSTDTTTATTVEARYLERRDVEILHMEGQRVFVRGLLTDGDLVVATGIHKVVAGQAVRIDLMGEGE
jgi:multidrug efflux pump subunit AcrA (membrane-fusion protein)